jgi:hypothetical protein
MLEDIEYIWLSERAYYHLNLKAILGMMEDDAVGPVISAELLKLLASH